MVSTTDSDLLTTAEVAKLLKVSAVTVARWIKQGRLPAYHLGPRSVRIRRADLATLMTPVVAAEAAPVQTVPGGPGHVFRPLTDEEAARQLEAIEQARLHRDEMSARRGGKLLSESWPLIREMREERSEHLYQVGKSGGRSDNSDRSE